MYIECWLWDMLRANVGGVGSPQNFRQGEGAGSEFVLHPEVADIKMSYAPQAPAANNADCCGGVRQNMPIEIEAQILRHGLKAKSLGCPSDYADELGFSGRKCNSWLCMRPMTNGMGPNGNNSSRC